MTKHVAYNEYKEFSYRILWCGDPDGHGGVALCDQHDEGAIAERIQRTESKPPPDQQYKIPYLGQTIVGIAVVLAMFIGVAVSTAGPPSDEPAPVVVTTSTATIATTEYVYVPSVMTEEGEARYEAALADRAERDREQAASRRDAVDANCVSTTIIGGEARCLIREAPIETFLSLISPDNRVSVAMSLGLDCLRVQVTTDNEASCVKRSPGLAPDGTDTPGNGYPVRCNDGWISPSGGIQGACSHHGGIAP